MKDSTLAVGLVGAIAISLALLYLTRSNLVYPHIGATPKCDNLDIKVRNSSCFVCWNNEWMEQDPHFCGVYR